ncbi:MAG: transposase [Deltaproteobacteria bacterium]|nr:transposase [Deltaproteobacteria bacterium]
MKSPKMVQAGRLCFSRRKPRGTEPLGVRLCCFYIDTGIRICYRFTMARKPRVQYQGAFYHVIARGNQRQKVFLDDEDYQQYRNRLITYQKRYCCTFYAYVLMSNHVHLLIEQGETDLSKIMQGLQQSYTMYFNKKYGKTGHLFQGRYKAIICDRDAYLLELIRYIHLNPVRAGITKLPDDYIWSSHHAYLSGRSSFWLEVEMPLACLAKSRKKAVSLYKDFINVAVNDGYREDLYEVKEQRYLGEDKFVEKLEKRFVRGKPIRFPVALDMDALVVKIGRSFKVPVGRIMDHTRSRDAALCRAVTAYVAKEVGSITLGEVARYFARDPVSISIGVRKLRERLEDDAELAAQMNRIEKSLRKGRRVKYKISKV